MVHGARLVGCLGLEYSGGFSVRRQPQQEEAGASQQTTAETGRRVQRVRGYSTGEPVLLKHTAWPGGPVRTENLKSYSPKAPLLGFGKVPPSRRSLVWQ